jgi:hypothetical protein
VGRLFVGYFNRAPDPGGGAYWTDQLHRGAAPLAIAQSFAASNEATGLYPFLASPAAATPSAVEAFVSTVYGNLFGRPPDPQGAAYWVTALQAGASPVGAAILNIIAGAQGADAVTLANKVAVGNFYDSQILRHGASFSMASASAAIAAVTSSDASVTSAMAAIEAYAGGASREIGLIGLAGTTDSHA